MAGDVVNTAARLQTLAPVNGTVVGDATYRSTRDLVPEPLEADGETVSRLLEALGRTRIDPRGPRRPSWDAPTGPRGCGRSSGSCCSRAPIDLATRRELVRTPPSSSVKDQAEYAFWHALIRDVAYGQIPRAARGEEHLAAARWLRETTGDRAVDFAYHYAEMLDLATAAGPAWPTRCAPPRSPARRVASRRPSSSTSRPWWLPPHREPAGIGEAMGCRHATTLAAATRAAPQEEARRFEYPEYVAPALEDFATLTERTPAYRLALLPAVVRGLVAMGRADRPAAIVPDEPGDGGHLGDPPRGGADAAGRGALPSRARALRRGCRRPRKSPATGSPAWTRGPGSPRPKR